MLAQDRRQALPVDRLGHKIGRAQWNRHAALVENRHHDHGDVAKLGVGLERLQRPPAIQLRHQHVERDRLWSVPACERQRLDAVAGRNDAIAFLFEGLGRRLRTVGSSSTTSTVARPSAAATGAGDSSQQPERRLGPEA